MRSYHVFSRCVVGSHPHFPPHSPALTSLSPTGHAGSACDCTTCPDPKFCAGFTPAPTPEVRSRSSASTFLCAPLSASAAPACCPSPRQRRCTRIAPAERCACARAPTASRAISSASPSTSFLPRTTHLLAFLTSPSLSSFALCDVAADSADDVLRRRERPWALHLLRLLWPRQYWKLPGYVERGTTTTRNKLTCSLTHLFLHYSTYAPFFCFCFCPRFFLIHCTGPHGHLGAACDCSTCPNSPYCDVPTCCGGDNPDLCDFSGAIGQSNSGFCPGPHGACNTCNVVVVLCCFGVAWKSTRR